MAIALLVVGLVCAAAAVVVVLKPWAGQVNNQGDPARDARSGTTIELPAAKGADRGGAVLTRVSGPAVMISSVDLDAGLDPINFVGNTLTPPSDVQRAGLWAGGAPLAASGVMPTVIAGHVSDDSDNPGEFRKLWNVRTGMIVVTRDAAGHLRRWRAVKEQVFSKDALPRSLFLPASQRVLRLITCADRESLAGGHFHYQDNLVVTFVPLGGTPL